MNDHHRLAALGQWPSVEDQRAQATRRAQDRVSELRAKLKILEQVVTLSQNPSFKLYTEKIQELRDIYLRQLVREEDQASRGAVQLAEGILAIHTEFQSLHKPLAEELRKAEDALARIRGREVSS